MSAAFWAETADALQGFAVLIGEHVDNRPDTDDAGMTDPTLVVETFAAAGVPAIVTLTGRDRSLRQARAEAMRLRSAGAAAIHCVTGDHPAAVGLNRPATFGAESMTLAAAVAEVGLPVTVAESPSSPGNRVERLMAKAGAGASACVLNHSGEVETLIAFSDECRAARLAIPLIAPLPMVADARAAAGLAALPGLRLPAGMLRADRRRRRPVRRGSRLGNRARGASGIERSLRRLQPFRLGRRHRPVHQTRSHRPVRDRRPGRIARRG